MPSQTVITRARKRREKMIKLLDICECCGRPQRTLKEIGEILGISYQRASQLHKELIKRGEI